MQEIHQKILRGIIHYIIEIILIALLWGTLWAIEPNDASKSNGTIYTFTLLFVCAYIGGELAQIVHLPPLLGMLIAGFVLRNASDVKINPEISATLRKFSLTIILLRAGLGLDPGILRKLSTVCLRLAFSPCIAETVTWAVTSHIILNLPIDWGFLLGFTLAAVSPAVVVPGMMHLQEKGRGTEKGIPTLVIAAASIDDVLAISGFGVLLGVVFSKEDDSLIWQIFKGPIEAIIGLIAGIIVGIFLWYAPVTMKMDDEYSRMVILHQRLILLTFFGLFSMFISHAVHFDGVGPLSVLCMAFVAAIRWRGILIEDSVKNALKKTKAIDAKEMEKLVTPETVEQRVSSALKTIWFFCQPFLFGLIGGEVSLKNLQNGPIGLYIVCLFIGLLFRSITATFVTWNANFNWREKIFVALAWLPKATVQAAVGPVALDVARSLDLKESEKYGETILTIAVLSILVTAPLGAVLIPLSAPCLLEKEKDDNKSLDSRKSSRHDRDHLGQTEVPISFVSDTNATELHTLDVSKL